MDGYLPRLMDQQLTAALGEVAAVAVEGPKGVGKTAAATRQAVSVIRLDDDSQRQAFEADPNRIRSLASPLLIDEWQRSPQAWDVARRWVDDGAPTGSVILTGSAHPPGAAVHSGAGRIVPLRMRPLSLAERFPGSVTVSLGDLLSSQASVEGISSVGFPEYVREITASGFPGIRSLAPRGQRLQLDAYIENVIHREFAQQGHVVRAPDTLRRWMRAYAAATATTASYATVLEAATPAEGAKPAKTTAIAYRDVLSSLWLLDPVEPWVPRGNELGRLSQAPKHFLADPALVCRLLELDSDELLGFDGDGSRTSEFFGSGYGPLLGRLFEALVALSLHAYASHAEARLGHFRTRNGDREVDFIVQRGRRVVAFEVKLSAAVDDSDVRHLRWLRDRLGPQLADAAVITTGELAYRRSDGIAVIPAALLGA